MTRILGLLPAALVAAALLVSSALCQAPGDESSAEACQRSYPNTWKVLMDSWRYKDLLGSDTAVWEARNVDREESTWGHGYSGLCERDIRGCGTFDGGTPNSWAFTQHIRKDILQGQLSNFSVKVYVNVTYAHSNCITSSGCVQQFGIYNYLVDTPQSTAVQTDTSRYSLLQNIQTSGTQEVIRVLDFDLSSNENGFYLAFQDTGTCVFISRVIVYRNECEERHPNALTTYPATPASRDRPLPNIRPLCVSNTNITTSDTTLTCTTMGEWTGEPLCSCELGYEENSGQCSACPAGTYRSEADTTCQSCPGNTFTNMTAAEACRCLPGYSNDWRVERDCLRAPSSPGTLTTTPPEVIGNTITVTWLPALDAGGCNDSSVHYNVYFLEENETEYMRANTKRIIEPCPDDPTVFCYTIRDLKTSTTYSVVVASANCATVDPATFNFSDVQIVQDRFIVFYATTDVTALPDIGPEAAAGIAFFVTFLVTLLATAAITAVLTVVLYRRYSASKGSQGTQRNNRVEFHSPNIGGSVKSTKQVNGAGRDEADVGYTSGKPSRPTPPYATKPSPKPVVRKKPVHFS